MRIHSVNGMLDRPDTCQMQVIPGVTSSRRWCQRSYSCVSAGIGGRGPTSDMSPHNTFHSCGSSSRLDLRRNRPIGVTRGSCLILKTGPDTSFWSSSVAFNCSASVTIERNLTRPNGRPPSPLRVWQKNTGPLDVALIPSAIRPKSGARKSKAVAETAMSTVRFHQGSDRQRISAIGRAGRRAGAPLPLW